MQSYIVRLDDACPTMNHKNWSRMEKILDFYDVKPIVGVIPDNQDSDFAWPEDIAFWKKVNDWQEKGWTIAQHGLHHKMHHHQQKRDYYQLSHSANTEFAGVTLEQQRAMLLEGNKILREHGIVPVCFFAPAHTYDANTVKACSETKDISFISDGYALHPYQKDDMVFLPSICDGPISTLPGGGYTFVFHPSMMNDNAFHRLESFLKQNSNKVQSVQEYMQSYEKLPNQGLIGWLLERIIFAARLMRKLVK